MAWAQRAAPRATGAAAAPRIQSRRVQSRFFINPSCILSVGRKFGLVEQRSSRGGFDQGRAFKAGPDHRAVPMAKYLLSKGGALRVAYHTRHVPSGRRLTDSLVM